MTGKRKRASTATARTQKKPTPPSAKAPTPAERLAALERHAAAAGIKPVDDAALDAMGEVWPEDESVDDFLAWLRKSRREGKLPQGCTPAEKLTCLEAVAYSQG